MESRTRRTLLFLLHMISAVVDDVGDPLKEIRNLLCGDPFLGNVGVVIIAIKGDDVGTNKVVVRSVIALVFGKDDVTGKGFSCHALVCQSDLCGIEAVGSIASALGCVNGHGVVVLHFHAPFFLLVGNGCG